MPLQPEAFFLPVPGSPGDQRFCLFHAAQGLETKGAILYVHPFAEEMNKSRRMAALQARALSRADYAVLQIDLLGCGDSSGNLAEATWQQWIDDVIRGCKWLQQRVDGPMWLWGLRAGCLLAADAVRQMPNPCSLVFWAPIATGKVQLQQFLRLAAVHDILGGDKKEAAQSPRHRLEAGESVEVAGYTISPELAAGMESSRLAPPDSLATGGDRRLEWFELSTRTDGSLSPAAEKLMANWRSAGFMTNAHIVNGPAFWQTTEIEVAPDLFAATVDGITLGRAMTPKQA